LASGGVFFTAFENKESLLWLLQTLEPTTRANLKTIFNDEDLALCAATVEFHGHCHSDLFHRICIFHKRRNVQKQVDDDAGEIGLHFYMSSIHPIAKSSLNVQASAVEKVSGIAFSLILISK
jgi:hypothetical protein